MASSGIIVVSRSGAILDKLSIFPMRETLKHR
jgi:hypothetical protein